MNYPVTPIDKLSLERALWAAVARLKHYHNTDDVPVINMCYRALGAQSEAHIKIDGMHHPVLPADPRARRIDRPLMEWELLERIKYLEERLGKEALRTSLLEGK